MAESPRVWNRDDVAAVMKFVGAGPYVHEVTELMEWVETFPHSTDAPPPPPVKAAIRSRSGTVPRG